MLQLPSDTIPFHFTGGAGQAWPSADACDVGEPVAQTDTQLEQGAAAAELGQAFHPPSFNHPSQRPQLLLLVTCLWLSEASCHPAGSHSHGHCFSSTHWRLVFILAHQSGRVRGRPGKPRLWPLMGHFPNANPAGSRRGTTSCPRVSF